MGRGRQRSLRSAKSRTSPVTKARRSPGSVTARTLEKIVDAFNRHDVDEILSYCADDVVWVMARGPHCYGRRYEGIAQMRDALIQRFKAIPDGSWSDGANWVCGDKGVSEWTLRGTTVKGEKLELLGCDLWRFRGGKVIKKDTYWKYVQPDFA